MLNNFIKSELGKDTIIFFIGLNIFNFLNFMFHFFMGRMLGPADYGVLAVLMSLIFIHGVPTESIMTIISRYTSKFNVKNEKGKINYLMKKSLAKTLVVSVIIFAVAVFVSLFLSY